MPIIKRINKYQGLKDIDVLVEESGKTSKYFQVFEFPESLAQGKSSFLIAGSAFLKNNVELKIEILDAGGNTVYTEPVRGYLEGKARRVSIEIYEDVVPGDGTLYIVGELRPNYRAITNVEENQDDIFGYNPRDIDERYGTTGNDIPSEFQNVYNVRYSREIFINPVIPNTQPIFFYKQPSIAVTEIVKPFIENQAPPDPITITGSIKVDPNPDIDLPVILPPPPEPTPVLFDMDPVDLELIGQEIEIFKKTRKAKINPFKNQSFRSRGRRVRRSSPEQDRFSITVESMQQGSENDEGFVSSAFVGGTIRINSPVVDTTRYPSTKYRIPTSYTSKVKKVKNNKTIIPLDDFLIEDIKTGERIPVKIITDSNTESNGGGSGGSGTGGTGAAVTMSYSPTPTASLSTTHFRSFAKVTTSGLRTFSGDVFKAKVYAKSQGALGDFEPYWEGPIESPQLLIDPFSDTGFVNVGYFHKQSVIDDYWISGSNTTVTRDDSKLIDGVEISGSNYLKNDSVTFETSASFELENKVPYTIQFNSYFYKELAQDNNLNDVTDFDCEVQVAESALKDGGLPTVYETLGRINIDNFKNVKEGEVPDVFATFVTPATGDPKLKIRLKVNKGRLVVNDIVARPYSETNFNPDYFECIFPLPYPLPKRPDKYDFLVEFYDINNNIAETFAIKEGVDFIGPKVVVGDGLDNIFSGSMLIGESMEMYGVNPAYLRSVGYNGFQNSIDSGTGGFMIFSGSVDARISASEASGFEYNGGVGLEIVDAGGEVDRYLRFRAQPSIFEVVTDTFFLGSTSQFISGSNTNIEISSSNFHLTPEGDVTMSGTITAEAGNLGDFQIIDGQISGSNMTLNANNSTLFKTDQGPGSDSTAAFPNLRDEYYIDFSPTVENPDNYYIKMGPNFMVDKDGILIASGAEFIGTITASAGLIGGFTVGSASLFNGSESTPNFFLSGSATGNDGTDKSNLFISSSGFAVTADGDITGSAVLFTGGKIAGFEIDGDKLKQGTSFHLDGGATGNNYFISSSNFQVEADGDVSGSSVFFDGGKIGGFTIGESTISSSNLIIDSSGDLRTRNFNPFLAGWRISSLGNGTAEFENIRVRGTLRTTTFEKETVNAVGGMLYVGNATVLSGSAASDDTALFVENVSGFEVDEIIFAKKVTGTGFTKEFMQVTGSSRTDESSDTDFSGFLHVTRGYGTALTGSYFTVPTTLNGGINATQTNITVANNSLLQNTPVIRIDNELMKVTGSASTDTIHVFRGIDGTEKRAHTTGTDVKLLNPDAAFLANLVSPAEPYTDGQSIVSTGRYIGGTGNNTTGSGYIMLNANPTTGDTPFIDFAERTGSGIYDMRLRTRLGDLSGLVGTRLGDEVAVSDNPGFGLAAENVFLSGLIKANSGSIAGIKMESEKLFVGNGTWGNSNTGFYLDSESSMSLADKFKWDNGTLTIEGTVNITGGDLAGVTSESIATEIQNITVELPDGLVSGSDQISDVTGSISSSLASRIMTEANGAIIATPDTSGLSGLILKSTHMGYASSGTFNSYIGSTGNFLFKNNDDNLISFGETQTGGDGQSTTNFVLKAENTYFSGSSVNILTDKFFLGKDSQFISGSLGTIQIKTQNFELESTNLSASSDEQYISLGAPTNTTDWSGRDGVWLSGSGEFNFQSSSQFIRNIGTDGGMEMNFGNFSVDTLGNMTANSASFKGTIEAGAGFFGSSATQGWNIYPNKIVDSSNVIEIDATPGSQNITITGSDDFLAELVPDFSTTSEVFSGAGTPLVATTISNTNKVDSGTISISNGNTHNETTDSFWRWASSGTPSTSVLESVHSPRPVNTTTKQLDSGKKHVIRFTALLEVDVNTSTANDGGLSDYFVLGDATTSGSMYLMKYDTDDTSHTEVGSLDLATFAHPETFQAGGGTTQTYSRSFTFSTSHVPGANEYYYLAVTDFKVTNNALTEYYSTTGGAKTFTNAINVSGVRVSVTSAEFQPSNKITQLAPKGLQTVLIGNSALENTANYYVRTDVNESLATKTYPKTLDILGSTVVTGSVVVAERNTDQANTDQVVIDPSAGTQITATGGSISATGNISSTGGYLMSSEYVYLGGSTNSNYFRNFGTTSAGHGIRVHVNQGGGIYAWDFLFESGGDFHADGDLVGFSSTVTSDERFKRNIQDINYGLNDVLKLRSVQFDWNEDKQNGKHDIGLIAQQVQEVIPDVVKEVTTLKEEDSKHLTVDYAKLTSVLIKAVQEQNERIEELESRLEKLDGNHE